MSTIYRYCDYVDGLTLETRTEQGDECSSILLAQQTIQYEVARGVNGQQEVEDIAQTTDQTTVVRVVFDGVKHCVYEN